LFHAAKVLLDLDLFPLDLAGDSGVEGHPPEIRR
jgi:hypothetical protein